MHDMSETGASIPAFLAKLWKMVDDLETDDLISWSPNGQSFIISNTARFVQELLPMYYKHNNLASFVRQLNMYGFHKITSVESGGLKSERDSMEFSHTCFCKGHPYLMQNIKRKMPGLKGPSSLTFVREIDRSGNDGGQAELLTQILTEVNNLKSKQANWDAKLAAMKRENEALWRELAIFRQKHRKQEQIINKLIHFIVQMVSTRNIPLRRRLPLMLGNIDHVPKAGSSPNGPTICELDLLGETANARLAETREKKIEVEKDVDVPSFVYENGFEEEEEDPETTYTNPYEVMSPNDEADLGQSPWILAEGSDFESDAMTPVNPMIINLPAIHAEESVDTSKQKELPSKAGSSKKGRKTLVAKKKLPVKKNRDILQETLNLIDLQSSDFTSPSSSHSGNVDDTESNAKILEILHEASSEPIPNSQGEHKKSDSDPLSMALTHSKFRSGIDDDDVARDLGSHVDTVQNDLDVLKEFLKGDNYNLDANALLELFSDDPFNLMMPPASDRRDDSKEGNELMMYNKYPNILDLSEVYDASEEAESKNEMPLSPSILETPIMTPATPGYPTPAKRRK